MSKSLLDICLCPQMSAVLNPYQRSWFYSEQRLMQRVITRSKYWEKMTVKYSNGTTTPLFCHAPATQWRKDRKSVQVEGWGGNLWNAACWAWHGCYTHNFSAMMITWCPAQQDQSIVQSVALPGLSELSVVLFYKKGRGHKDGKETCWDHVGMLGVTKNQYFPNQHGNFPRRVVIKQTPDCSNLVTYPAYRDWAHSG